MIYLDTHVAVMLYQADLNLFSREALEAIEKEDDLRFSPMALLELEYLHEIKRIKISARRIFDALAGEIGLKLCDATFADLARRAVEERWTRDPFDRLILAHARLQKAILITRDQEMQSRYANAIG